MTDLLNLHPARPGPAHVTHLAPVALAGFDADLVCTWANPRFADLVGRSEQQLPGATWPGLVPGLGVDDQAQVEQVLAGLSPGANLQVSLDDCRHPSARETWRLHVYPLTVGDRVEGLGLVGLDVTDDLVQLEGLRRRAEVDGLTGLLNRSTFHARMHEHVATAPAGRRSRLLVIDLDGFKGVNDTYGHAAGDAVLAEVGRRLRGALGEDDVAGRIGGDEFAVIAADRPGTQPSALVRSLREVIAVPVQLGPGLQVGVSVAIGHTPVTPGTTPEEVMAAADTAMYSAKRRARGLRHDRTVVDLSDGRPQEGGDPVLDRACGLVMGRSGCSERQALDALARIARATNRSLLDVAADLDREARRPGERRGAPPAAVPSRRTVVQLHDARAASRPVG
jgi:cyclic di-GMP phosphodiesterase Gmr